MSSKNERIRQILVIVATAGMIFVNYLAGTGYINNTTTGAVSAKYPTMITAAGYAFSIWGLIYVWLAAFSIYQSLPSGGERFRTIRTVYILSCAANCAWIICWQYEMILACVGLIFLLLGTLALINVKLQKTETNGEYWLAKVPFGIYFGWVTAASILNAAIGLVYLKVSVSDAAAEKIGTGLLFVAAAIGVAICLKLKNYFYPLAIAWALTAIAVNQGVHTLIVGAAAVGVAACLIASISFVMNMKTTKINAE